MERLEVSLKAEVRNKDMEKASYYLGQIDLIPTILGLPEKRA